MGDMKTPVALLICGGFVLAAVHATVGAQASRSVNEGIYTKAQADRGKTLYDEQCATCHGDNLEGSGPMPPLAGKDFLALWTGKSVGELFDKVHTTMPATAPGTLTPEQSADILAYMLSKGNFPAGATELAPQAEVLSQIKIEEPVATGAAPATAAPAPTTPNR